MHTKSYIATHMLIMLVAIEPLSSAPVSKVPSLIIGVEPSAYNTEPFIQGLSKKYRSMNSRPFLRNLGDLPLYQIEMDLDLLSAQATVIEQINFKNITRKPISRIVLRTMANAPTLRAQGRPNLVFTDTRLNNNPVGIQNLGPTTYSLRFPLALRPGHRVLVHLSYQLRIPSLPAQATVPGGVITPNDMIKQVFGKEAPAGYGVLGHSKGIYNLGYFYPVLASRNTGSWDTTEPSGMGDMSNFQVANYQVKVSTAQNAVCVTSGILVGANPLGSGAQAAKESFFIATAVRNFAMQVSTRYQVAKRKYSTTTIRYIYLPEHKKAVANTLKQVTGAVDTYSRLFAPYPYPELDVVEAPLMGGAGGIEYPGMVTVAMALGDVRSAGNQTSMAGSMISSTNTYEFVLAHEIAHQWFNGLVGSDSNLHPFVDEALANYSAMLYFEAKHDAGTTAEQFQNQLVVPYQLMRAMGGPDAPADLPTGHYKNQLQYSAIIYSKAALFLHTLRKKVGRKRFFKALRKYVWRYSFRQATPKDLLDTMAEASGKPRLVRKLYKRWIEQKHGDEDIGVADLNQAMRQLMKHAADMKGFHNYNIQGLDPATMKMFQRALQQMQGVAP